MRPKIKTYEPGQKYRYAHLKRDGMWLELCGGFQAHSAAGAWSRHPTNLYDQLSQHPTVIEFFRRAAEMRYAVLYCELFAPGYPQSEVKSMLAQGKMGGLVIESFATPCLADDAELPDVRQYSLSFGTPFVDQYWCVSDLEEFTHDKVFEVAMQIPDTEGLVYKDGNLLNWCKRKAEPTADLVITGFTEGKGKYQGLIGALELSVYVPPAEPKLGTIWTEHVLEDEYRLVCACSGMDDDTRRTISEDRNEYLGKVVEVKYQYVGSRGGLRHPRFVRFRDDKRPEECAQI